MPSEKAFDPTAHLSYDDISANDAKHPSIIFMWLKKSKTDPFRKGVSIPLGATNMDLCLVSALLAYLALRGPQSGPLFQWHDGTPLTRGKFVEAVRGALTRANLPAKDFAGHSFRIGAASTVATDVFSVV